MNLLHERIPSDTLDHYASDMQEMNHLAAATSHIQYYSRWKDNQESWDDLGKRKRQDKRKQHLREAPRFWPVAFQRWCSAHVAEF